MMFNGYRVLKNGVIRSKFGEVMKITSNNTVVLTVNGDRTTYKLIDVIYEAYNGKLPEGERLDLVDVDKPIELSNITLRNSGFNIKEMMNLKQFLSILEVLAQANLEMKDFKFLKDNIDKKLEVMSKSDREKWENIMFRLVDARRDFLLGEAVCPEVEEVIEDLTSNKKKFVESRISTNLSNFKKLLSVEGDGRTPDDFIKIDDLSTVGTGNKKYWFISVKNLAE